MKVYVARQPIFDKNKQVFAYELLFRNNDVNAYQESIDGDAATSSVITNSLLVIGMEALTGGRPAFINFTQSLLLQEVATVLPKEHIVIEILETVSPDEDIITACRNLKNAGYTLALDDFVLKPGYQALIDLADIIKVDFMLCNAEERELIVKQIGNKVQYLAEKVETWEDFEQAMKHGYSYFQGYFFSKPIIVTGDSIPATKLSRMRLLQEIHQPELSLKKIEEIMKHDVALSYKMFKYINCTAFGFRGNIQTIKHALVLLGEREVVKWITLCALIDLAEETPGEVLIASVARARFAELLARQSSLSERASDAFLMGIFSMIDVLVNRTKSEIFEQLPIAKDIKDALLNDGQGEGKLSHLYSLIKAYETGQWDVLPQRAERLRIEKDSIADLYMESIEWANGFM